jgi:hypothetical protein
MTQPVQRRLAINVLAVVIGLHRAEHGMDSKPGRGRDRNGRAVPGWDRTT